MHMYAGSLDSIEVDLGELSLRTTGIAAQPLTPAAAAARQQALLVESVGLRFSGASIACH